MKELTIEAKVDNVETVTDFVNEFLEGVDCPMKAQIQIDVAIDEIFANIAHYAYAPNVGNATIKVDELQNPHAVSVTFIDSGVPFNPLEKDDPDVTLSAEDRAIGGLGIFMVKKSMDSVVYEFVDGQNTLTIKKNI